MASRYWIKLYHEILDDPKMGRLTDRTWRRAVELFLLAGKTGRDGALPSVGDMAWTLHISEEDLVEDLNALMDVGIVTHNSDDWNVTHFSERQRPVGDAERQRRKRKRKQQEQYYEDGNKDVTNRDTESHENVTKRDTNRNKRITNRDVDTDIDTDTDTETESESESPSSSPPTPPPKSKPPPKPETTTGQQFLALFGTKRFRTTAQRDAVSELEHAHGSEKLLAAAQWAAEKGMTPGQAIVAMRSALPNWGKPRPPGPNTVLGRKPQAQDVDDETRARQRAALAAMREKRAQEAAKRERGRIEYWQKLRAVDAVGEPDDGCRLEVMP